MVLTVLFTLVMGFAFIGCVRALYLAWALWLFTGKKGEMIAFLSLCLVIVGFSVLGMRFFLHL